MNPEVGQVPWLSPDERQAWLATYALMMQLPTALDSQLQRDVGVSFYEYMVLAVLSEQPDNRLQMTDIAEFTSSSLSRLSHTAARLEKQGLIRREAVPGHGRRTQAELTEAGLAKVKQAAPLHVAHVRELLFDGTTKDDLEALTRIGASVVAKINLS